MVNLNDSPQAKPAKQAVSISFDFETMKKLNAYMALQEYKPSRSAVVARALDLLFEKAGLQKED